MNCRTIEDLATILAYELLEKHGLTDWAIMWHDDGQLAGRCTFKSKVISLNRRALLDTAAHNIVETILHEVAHALVGSEHNQEWHDKLVEIGGNGWWIFNDGRVNSVVLDTGPVD